MPLFHFLRAYDGGNKAVGRLLGGKLSNYNLILLIRIRDYCAIGVCF
jgi:hypothetical protein